MSDPAVVTLAMETLTLHRAGSPKAALGQRLLTAAVLIPPFVWLLLGTPPWVFAALVVLVAAVASWELARLFERAGRAGAPLLAVVAGTAVTASFLHPRAPVAVLTAAVIALFAVAVWRAERAGAAVRPSVEPVVLGLLGLGYVNWLLGHALLLRGLPDGAALVLLLVGVTWAGESAAYAVGSAVGRHKLAPAVSPGKTVEGALAQGVVSAVAAPLLAAWLLPHWSVGGAMGAGILLGIAGQLGDLAESVIKRSVGVKDASDLIPGHGGLLDRLDGLLFNAPVLFYYVRWAAGS